MSDYLSGLEPGEVAALRDLLWGMVMAAPDSGEYSPYVAHGGFGMDELREALYEEASDGGPAIRQAAQGYLLRGKWRRLKKREQFFLEARLGAAVGYCCDWLRAHNLPANMAGTCLPRDVSIYVERLLSDYWDDRACRVWVSENEDCISCDDE